MPDEGLYHGGAGVEVPVGTKEADGLRMPRGQMLELGHKVLQLVVERIENLPNENA